MYVWLCLRGVCLGLREEVGSKVCVSESGRRESR